MVLYQEDYREAILLVKICDESFALQDFVVECFGFGVVFENYFFWGRVLYLVLYQGDHREAPLLAQICGALLCSGVMILMDEEE